MTRPPDGRSSKRMYPSRPTEPDAETRPRSRARPDPERPRGGPVSTVGAPENDPWNVPSRWTRRGAGATAAVPTVAATGGDRREPREQGQAFERVDGVGGGNGRPDAIVEASGIGVGMAGAGGVAPPLI